MKIEGRGHLGLILMKALKLEYNAALDLVEDIETQAKKQGFVVTIAKVEQ